MTQNTQDQIKEVCDSIKELLLQKNAKYGDSALNPERVFSKADAVEQIKVRIDDKLSRIATTGFSAIDEDTLQDLIGYLVLLKIALSRQEKSSPYAVPYEDVLEDYAACPCEYGQKQDSDCVRVYELAFRLGLTNREVLEACDSLDINVKSHSSLLSATSVSQIHAFLFNRERQHEDVLRYYGETVDEAEAWPFEVSEEDWEEDPVWVHGWDDSLGPVEIEPEEIQERLAKKNLNQFADDEIVSTIERRGMIIGFRRDGSSCLIKDGRCE